MWVEGDGGGRWRCPWRAGAEAQCLQKDLLKGSSCCLPVACCCTSEALCRAIRLPMQKHPCHRLLHVQRSRPQQPTLHISHRPGHCLRVRQHPGGHAAGGGDGGGGQAHERERQGGAAGHGRLHTVREGERCGRWSSQRQSKAVRCLLRAVKPSRSSAQTPGDSAIAARAGSAAIRAHT